MRKMTYAFYASFKAPSVGVQEVHKYPGCPGKKSQGLQERGISHKSRFATLGQQATAINWDIS